MLDVRIAWDCQIWVVWKHRDHVYYKADKTVRLMIYLLYNPMAIFS